MIEFLGHVPFTGVAFGWILKSPYHRQVPHLYRTLVRQPRSIDCTGLNGVRDFVELFEGGFKVVDYFLRELRNQEDCQALRYSAWLESRLSPFFPVFSTSD
jgi:hypothetical protein